MRPLTLRHSRLALGLAALVAVTACSSSSSKTATTAGSGTSPTTVAPTATIASKLVLGGPAECQQNAFCLPGLTRVYGVTFASFKTLDADGPLTYAALGSGAIQ